MAQNSSKRHQQQDPEDSTRRSKKSKIIDNSNINSNSRQINQLQFIEAQNACAHALEIYNNSNSNSDTNSLNNNIAPRVEITENKCIYCNKIFGTNYYLTVHMRVHIGERPYECKECNKSYTTNSNLKRHMNIHLPKNFQPNAKIKKIGKNVCVYCNKIFEKKSHLTEHLSIHTGERPYACKKCNKSFKTNRYLKIHMNKFCNSKNDLIEKNGF